MGVLENAATQFRGVEAVRERGNEDIGEQISKLSKEFDKKFKEAQSKLEGINGKLNSLMGKNADPEGVRTALNTAITRAMKEGWSDGAFKAEEAIYKAISALKTAGASKEFIADTARASQPEKVAGVSPQVNSVAQANVGDLQNGINTINRLKKMGGRTAQIDAAVNGSI